MAEKLPAWSGFHGVTANPKIETVEQIVAQFRVEKARAFIDAIYRMNRALGIPERFPCIRPEDLPQMAAWAEAEANPVYPVPVIFGKEDFIRVARRVMP